mmetsp:Transcript_18103/g.26788  ORF Transcript_18103/g.26788 Transcript_18103/m.26788 type:complete len:992 (+) Transcript_18103:138-3113(+)
MDDEMSKHRGAYQISSETLETEEVSICSDEEDEKQSPRVRLAVENSNSCNIREDITRDANHRILVHEIGKKPEKKETEQYETRSQEDKKNQLEYSVSKFNNQIRNQEHTLQKQLFQLQALENTVPGKQQELREPEPTDVISNKKKSLDEPASNFHDEENQSPELLQSFQVNRLGKKSILWEQRTNYSDDTSSHQSPDKSRNESTCVDYIRELEEKIIPNVAEDISKTEDDKKQKLHSSEEVVGEKVITDDQIRDSVIDDHKENPLRKSSIGSQQLKEDLVGNALRKLSIESSRPSMKGQRLPEREKQLLRKLPTESRKSSVDIQQLQGLEESLLGKSSIGSRKSSFDSQQVQNLEGSVFKKSVSGSHRLSNESQQLQDLEGSILNKCSIGNQRSLNAPQQLRDLEGSLLRKASMSSSIPCSKISSAGGMTNDEMQPGAYYAEYSTRHTLDDESSNIDEEINISEQIDPVLQSEEYREYPPPAASESRYDSQPETKRRRTGLVVLLSVMFGISVIAGIGTFIGLNEHGKTENQDIEDACGYNSMPDALVRAQCNCTNRVTNISATTQQAYYKLLEALKTTLYDEYYEKISSCSTRNIALVHVSSQRGFDVQNQLQRFLLCLLYLEWKGTTWDINTGWLSKDPVCTWYGISCHHGVVTGLELPENHLDGGIVRELFFLRSLERLVISKNNVAGSVPTELGLLTNLTRLAFDGINLKGNFPTEVGRLTSLQELDISAMHGLISDAIPSEVGLLTNLEVFNFTKNRVTGTLPSELGLLSNLEKFDCSYNLLIGNFPLQMNNLSRLTELVLSGNSMSGTLPDLSNFHDLRKFNIAFTSFDDVQPIQSLWNLSNLVFINLVESHLVGSIPPKAFEKITNLEDFFAASNHLTGSIPSQVGKLTNLRNFDVTKNKLSGTLPTELGSCGSLETIFLHDNFITGTVPVELQNIPNLDKLLLGDNGFTGTISKEQCQKVSIVETDCIYLRCPCINNCRCTPF